MVNVKFTKQILDTEMTVVRNEFERGENNPASILRERVASTAYLWHNYGKSTIGSKEDLEKVPDNRLAEFYKKFYQPDNAVLVITGRIDEPKTLQMVADSLGKLPRPARVLDQTYTVEPAQDGERFVTLRRVGQGQNLIVAYHAVSAAHPDAAALQVLSAVMSGGGGGGRGGRGGGGGAQEGRLAKALVDTKLAESASMGFQLQHDPGLVQVSATLKQDQSLDAARDAVYKTLDEIVKNPPTDAEVDRVKTQLLRGLENSLSNAQAIATGALNNAIAQGDWRLMFLQHDRLQAVTPADLVRVAQSYFKPSNRTVGYYIPDPAPGSHGGDGRAGSVGDAAQLLEHGHRRARRNVRPRDPQHRRPRRPLEAAQRDEGRRPVEEDREQHRHRDDRPALRRSDVAGGPAGSGVVRRRPADGRHQDATRGSSSRTRCAS